MGAVASSSQAILITFLANSVQIMVDLPQLGIVYGPKRPIGRKSTLE